MKVEIKLTPMVEEPYAVIYTSAITPEIRHTAGLIQSENTDVIPVLDDERIIILRRDEIYLVRVEGGKTIVYTKNKHYDGGKRLYEIEALLGNGFMKISKSAIINLKQVSYAEPTLGGLMLLILKNGCKEHISRKYLPTFKKYLGL